MSESTTDATKTPPEAMPLASSGADLTPPPPATVAGQSDSRVGRWLPAILALLVPSMREELAAQPVDVAQAARWSRRALHALGIVLLVIAVVPVVSATRKLIERSRIVVVPTTHPKGYVTRLDLAQRKRIFAEIIAAFPGYWRKAERSFPGKPWSISDDFHHWERIRVGYVASRHRLTRIEGYMILDEGIREGWPGWDKGKPLRDHPPPLRPRIR